MYKRVSLIYAAITFQYPQPTIQKLKCWTFDFSIIRGEKGEKLSVNTWAKRSESIICLSTDKSNSFAVKTFQAYKNSAALKFRLIEFRESQKLKKIIIRTSKQKSGSCKECLK